MKKKGQKDNTAKQEAKARKKEEKIRKKAEKNEQKSKKKKEKAAAKAQKQKAKAAAKAKKQDAKKAKAAAKNNKKQAEGAEGKKKLNKKLLIPLLALLLIGGGALAATFVLGGKALPAVEAYVIAEESALPLDDFLAAESRLVKIRQAKLEDAEEEEPEEEAAEDGEETAKPVPIYTVLTYEYKGVTAEALKQYAEALLGEEQGFVMVDEDFDAMTGLPGFVEMTEAEIEAFAAAELQGEEPPELGPTLVDEDGKEVERKMTEGSQLLAREASVEGRLFVVRLTWTAKGKCSVEVSCPEAEFPVAEEEERSMNQTSAMDYVSQMSPSVLGLEGESMDEYRTYSQGDNVIVDGQIFRKFTVYTLNEKTNTNDFVGVFLISGNGRTIYRQDGVTGELYPVK